MNTIIGYTGFVGSNLCRDIKFTHHYNSKNINSIDNLKHDVIYCCGISGNKFWANKNGEEDKKNIDFLIECLKTVECNKFILISSIDVYNKTINSTEDGFKCDSSHHPYGFNRYNAEKKLEEIFGDKLQIIRLPALFGNNLKKNILYDLIHNKFYGKINLENKMQFYYISRLHKDINYLISNNVKELNLFTEPLTIGEIVDLFFNVNNEIMYNDKSTAFIYDLKTKHSLTGYWLPKEDVIKDLNEWVKEF